MHHWHRAHRATYVIFAVTAALVLFATPGFATQIGPDAFGYTATDEVTHTFEDISLPLAGTRILDDENDATQLVSLGFSFGFYGSAETDVHISTNGLLAFGASYPWFVNRELDSALILDDPRIIAPLWHDWNFDEALQPAADAVYYATLGSPGSQRFVVQWNRAYNDTPTVSDPVTFQVVLFESGNLLFHYPDVTTLVNPSDNGGSATIGIRNTGGTSSGQFLQWSFNQPVLSDGDTILFVVPEPSSAALLAIGMLGLARRRRRA